MAPKHIEAFLKHDFTSNFEDEWVSSMELGNLSKDEAILEGEIDQASRELEMMAQ